MKQLLSYFSQNPLDRIDYIKDDEKEVLKLFESKEAIFLFFDGSNIFIDEEKKAYFFKRDVLEKEKINHEEVVLLGVLEGKPYFALRLEESTLLKKVNLREFCSFDFCDEKTLGIVAQGCAILNWHNNHKFCSFCAEKTVIQKSGNKSFCPVCKKEHFARVDPVVIMLVTFGDYCLLGRGVNFKKDRYSCLAGYVESGETFESAALRELYEEAGIKGKNVKYISSQPWPFPSSIMIGMSIEAISQELKLDKNEIADAKWVHKDDVKAILEGNESYYFTLPDKLAIARNLLEYWVYTT